jgi:hypothetical protein
MPRRGDELTTLLAGSCMLTAGTVTSSSFWACRLTGQGAGQDVGVNPVNQRPRVDGLIF